jgi:hypothetical protein
MARREGIHLNLNSSKCHVQIIVSTSSKTEHVSLDMRFLRRCGCLYYSSGP